MRLEEIPEVWEQLKRTRRAVVLYGMGNGADKILGVCRKKGIPVREVFASDGFVRGQIFHGMQVLSWSQIKEKYGADGVAVLLSFGSSRPEVLETIRQIDRETELYAPDVPAFGDGIFDRAFALAHREEIDRVRELFSDEESRRIYDLVLTYKISGRIAPLLEAVSDPDEVRETLIRPREIACAADLGAYTGDTVRELLDGGAAPETVFALEPDARNFKKLSLYAQSETRTRVQPVRAAAWDREETLLFDASGNRNASAGENRSAALSDRPVRWNEIPAAAGDTLFGDAPVDYIKFDVEGAEARALAGCAGCIRKRQPTLLVSLYHRNEDLFSLPGLIREQFPFYQGFYLRRFAGIPAWNLNLYVRKEPIA